MLLVVVDKGVVEAFRMIAARAFLVVMTFELLAVMVEK